jgi:microsomal epoxide hydrolase/non-specific protein-tyrosine kinase
MVITFPAPKRIRLPEVTLEVHEAGAGPAVVMCHGFPELAYSWRYQVNALAGAGFRAIAPNQRGYGGSDAPREIGDYSLDHLCDDMAHLLDALGIERAVFAGHDWGGFVSWGMTVRHPDRCLGAIGVNTPYMGFPTTEQLRAVFKDDDKLYILWFQKPGIAEGVLDRNPRLVFEKLMRRATGPATGNLLAGGAVGDANPFRRLEDFAPMGEPLLSDAELDVYARAFQKSGFRGGINWYRNADKDRRVMPDLGVRKLTLPCLMVTASWDGALPPAAAAGMRALCDDLEVRELASGHWTQQEQPGELARAMIDWLRRKVAA